MNETEKSELYKEQIFSPHNKKKNRGEEPEQEVEVLQKLNEVLESGNLTKGDLTLSKELAKLHRMVENTKARRRLEKWSLKIIKRYLIVILLLVILCYSNNTGCKWIDNFTIPNIVMNMILGTTTANIIGLGLIVLRGHFLASEKDKK